MDVTFQFTCVAYSRSVGGAMRVLLAIDQGDRMLFDGEPVLLAEHRPSADASALRVEGPDAMDPVVVELVRSAIAIPLAALVDGSFGRDGELRLEQLLDARVAVLLPSDTFDR